MVEFLSLMAWYLLLQRRLFGGFSRQIPWVKRWSYPPFECHPPAERSSHASLFRAFQISNKQTWLKVGSWWSWPVHLTTSNLGFCCGSKNLYLAFKYRAPECLIGGLWWLVLIRICWEFQTIYRPKPLIDLICPAGKYESLKSTSNLQNVPLHQPLVLPPIVFSIFDPYSIHQSYE